MTASKKTRTVKCEQLWAAELPASVVYMIATLILQDDVVDFYSFRSTCHFWRLYTTDLMQDLSGPCFRPRKWIMLSDGNGFSTKPKCFLNISNGRLLWIRVPELDTQPKVFTTAEGLLIIGNNTETILLNPLTRFCIEFPTLFLHPREILLRVTSSAITSATTVILCIQSLSFNEDRLPYYAECKTIRFADKKSKKWKILYDTITLSDNMRFQKTLLYQDQLYTVERNGTIKLFDMMSPHVVRVIIPPTLGPDSLSFNLVESRGQMLLVCKVFKEGNQAKVAFKVYKVDISNKNLIPMDNIGDQALFILDARTLSISTSCFSTVEANSIYFVRHFKMLGRRRTYRMGRVYSLLEGSSKNLHLFGVLNEIWVNIFRNKEQQSMQSYSLLDHILCYCYQGAWSKGLMYHEFYEDFFD